MTDTHTHIYEPEFDEDRDLVVRRAIEAGVGRLLLPNINEESIPRMMALAQKYPGVCYPMIGLHPEDVREDWQEVLDRMEVLLRNPESQNLGISGDPEIQKSGGLRVVAVGECGLDFYWDDTYRQQQIDAFERQICMARELDLPLVIHTRKAEPELLRAMKSHASEGLRGIFHCFSGSVETAAQLMRFEGFAFGIGGVLTFKNSNLRETLQTVPLERIVLETDAPYLAPAPYRGQRNEPSYIPRIAEVLAKVYGVALSDVECVTERTVRRVFGDL